MKRISDRAIEAIGRIVERIIPGEAALIFISGMIAGVLVGAVLWELIFCVSGYEFPYFCR